MPIAQDVKPENFLFGGPKEDVLKLCDFGLALRQPKKGKKLSGVGGAICDTVGLKGDGKNVGSGCQIG